MNVHQSYADLSRYISGSKQVRWVYTRANSFVSVASGTHRILFYFVLFLLPTQLTKHFFIPSSYVTGIRIDYLAPVLYSTDMLIGAVLLLWLTETVLQRKLNPQLKLVPILVGTLLFSLACMNIVSALSPTTALFGWLRVGEMILLSLYVVKTKPPVFLSIFLLLVSGVYSAVIAWGQWLEQSSVSPFLYWIGERSFTISTPGIARTELDGKLFLRPYATFPHPNVLAGYIAALLPFSLYFQRSRNQFLRLVWLPVYIAFISTIVITFSQSAWGVTSISSLLLVSIIGKWKWRKVITGIAIVLLLFWTLSRQLPLIETESLAKRIKLANTASLIVRSHPFIGVGLNNFIIAIPKYQTITTYQDLQPVHNIYLLLASEIGLSGLLLFLGLLVAVFRKIDENSFSGSILLLSLSSLLLLGLVDHYLLTSHQTLLLFAILVGFVFQKDAKRVIE